MLETSAARPAGRWRCESRIWLNAGTERRVAARGSRTRGRRTRSGGSRQGGKGNRRHRASPVVGPREGAVVEGIRKRARFWHGTTRAVNGVSALPTSLQMNQIRSDSQPPWPRTELFGPGRGSHDSGEIMRERKTRRSGPAEGAGVMDPSRHLLGMQSLVANRLYDAEGNFVGKLEEVILDVRAAASSTWSSPWVASWGSADDASPSLERADPGRRLPPMRDRRGADAAHRGAGFGCGSVAAAFCGLLAPAARPSCGEPARSGRETEWRFVAGPAGARAARIFNSRMRRRS